MLSLDIANLHCDATEISTLTSSVVPVETTEAGAACGPFAGASASSDASASCYRFAEDVGILAVVMTKRELCEVKRKVLAADMMETPHDAALQETPERFDVIRVNLAANIDIIAMLDDPMRVDAI